MLLIIGIITEGITVLLQTFFFPDVKWEKKITSFKASTIPFSIYKQAQEARFIFLKQLHNVLVYIYKNNDNKTITTN